MTHRLDALHGGMAPEDLLAAKQQNPNIVTWTDDLPYSWLDPCPRTLDLNHLMPPLEQQNHAVSRPENANQRFDGALKGEREALISWFSCGSVMEPWDSLDNFNTRWLRPRSQATQHFENVWRWSGNPAEEYSAIVDQIGQLPLGDPAIDALFIEAMRIWLDELPAIPLVQAGTLLPFDTTYWSEWPTATNNYIQPPIWWQSTHKILHHLQSVP